MLNEGLAKNVQICPHRNCKETVFFNKAKEFINQNISSSKGKELSLIIWGFSNVDFEDKEFYDFLEINIAKLFIIKSFKS